RERRDPCRHQRRFRRPRRPAAERRGRDGEAGGRPARGGRRRDHLAVDPLPRPRAAAAARLDRAALREPRGRRHRARSDHLAAHAWASTYPAPARVAPLTLPEPSTLVERNADASLTLAALGRRRAAAPGAPVTKATAAPAAAPAVDVAVRRLSIVGGRARVIDAVTGGRLDAAAIDVTAEDASWPSRGPARVRVSTDVAGGRLSARGTVEPAPARGNLAITARKVDLATLQPWLPPAAGRLRGAADADVTVGLALQPLSVEAKGTVSGPSLVWTGGVRPTVNVASLDVRAED